MLRNFFFLFALLDIKNSFRQIIRRYSLCFLFFFICINIKILFSIGNLSKPCVIINALRANYFITARLSSFIHFLYTEMHAHTFYFIAVSDIINSAFRVELLRIVIRNNAVILLYYT